MTKEYVIFVRTDDNSPIQAFGKLIVDIPKHDDGYNTDCIVNELMNAATSESVRDCIWEAKEI